MGDKRLSQQGQGHAHQQSGQEKQNKTEKNRQNIWTSRRVLSDPIDEEWAKDSKHPHPGFNQAVQQNGIAAFGRNPTAEQRAKPKPSHIG